MKLIPLFDRVLLEREKLGGAEGKSAGGVLIPKAAAVRNAPFKGKVIAVGEGVDDSIDVGRIYIFGVHAGAWINSDGKPVTGDDATAEFFICVDKDLLCEVQE